MEKDRRKHERQSTEDYLPVYDGESGELIGELVNLSPTGAMFITPKPVSVSTTIRCRVELPQPILGRREIIFDAECRWCRKNIQAARWESGYLLAVTGIDAELVSYLIIGFKFQDWGEDDLPEARTADLACRRRSVRYEFDHSPPVYELRSYRQIGELADLSIDGIRLLSAKPVSRGELLECRVKLPRKVFEEEYLVLSARCMWCKRYQGGERFESGYRLEHVSEQDSAIILHLLIHFAHTQSTRKRVKVIR